MCQRIKSRPLTSKRAAQRFVQSNGYTVLHDTGQSGDHPWGSREYWCKPGAKKNAYGWPLDTLWISQVGRQWVVDHHVQKVPA